MAGAVTGNITPQQNTTVLASGNYSTAQVSAPVSVPADHNSFAVTVSRTSLPNTTSNVVSVRVDCSVDGGATWSPDADGRAVWPWGPFPIKFTAPGGILKDRNGLTAAVSSIMCGIPANPNQHLKVTVTPLVPVQTQAKIATANGTVSASAIS